jgi:hypothetical protein
MKLARFRGQNEIGDRAQRIAHRGLKSFATTSSVQGPLSHQARDAFIAEANSGITQIGLDSRPTVRRTRLTMKRFDSVTKLLICNRACRRLALRPRIITARGDLQDAAHGGDGIIGLVRFHESVDFLGTTLVSRANQTVAFDRISRSISSCETNPESGKSEGSSVRLHETVMPITAETEALELLVSGSS